MILVIDNYDSFTWNLVHYVEELGARTHVIRNDQLTTQEALALNPQALLLSPGPCTPDEAGICVDLIRAAPPELPILGVCLGHQAIGRAYGGDIVRARQILHGKCSLVGTSGEALFDGLPGNFTVVRYHSLAIRPETLPAVLVADAWTDDGEIMAVRHRDRPVYGVQFHPESIKTEHGHALLANFLKQVK